MLRYLIVYVFILCSLPLQGITSLQETAELEVVVEAEKEYLQLRKDILTRKISEKIVPSVYAHLYASPEGAYLTSSLCEFPPLDKTPLIISHCQWLI